MAKPDFRAAATARLNEERGQSLSQNVLSLLSADKTTIIRPTAVRNIPVDRIDPNPNQPRMAMDKAGLDDLTASVREHGVLQPILVRPETGGRYQLIAGERRLRAARAAGLTMIPALIEEIDDETALEIAVIENLQREDLSPLDEALIYAKMIHQHGYSIRKLAQRLGKDKGYLENRLRLADAPAEIRELVSVRKDTLSHTYELLKVPARQGIHAGCCLQASAGRSRDRKGSRGRRGSELAGRRLQEASDGRLSDGPQRPIQRRHRRPCGAAPIGRHEDHRLHGPAEPGEVPDDRQGAPGERHRRRPAG